MASMTTVAAAAVSKRRVRQTAATEAKASKVPQLPQSPCKGDAANDCGKGSKAELKLYRKHRNARALQPNDSRARCKRPAITPAIYVPYRWGLSHPYRSGPTNHNGGHSHYRRARPKQKKRWKR
jgi:hypothetical protein